jgi:hypothetical protein
LCANVNFTLLAEEGMKMGLSPIFFGKQNKMRLQECAVISSKEKEYFDEHTDKSSFAVLVQRKEKNLVADDASARFTDKTMPLTHSQLFSQRFRETVKPLSRLRLIKAVHAHIKTAAASKLTESKIREVLRAVDAKEYCKALRTVCYLGHEPLIDLFISYAKKLEFDINEKSFTQDLTALDWLYKSKISGEEQIKISVKLRSAGAKFFHELKQTGCQPSLA